MKYQWMRGMRIVSLCLILSIIGVIVGFGVTKISVAHAKSRFEKLELFNKVLYLVESQYYRDVDTEKLIQGALRGMLDTLDPHSAFLDEDLFSKMQEDTQGEFGGLGLEVSQKDGMVVVITPIEDSPAFKAGMLPGDKIVEINHESIIGLTLEEAVEKMKGKANTKINIGVLREGHDGIMNFNIMRKIIKTKPVKSAEVAKGYLYIRLKQFQKDSSDYIIKAIKKYKKKNKIKGIILDLRGNPGGLLDEAVNVSSIFLKTGVVVSTEGRDPKEKDVRFVRKAGHKELKVPLGVLINGQSASASEIVAGALQDHKRAIVMGTQSFGKGSVQTISKLDDKQGIKLTIAQYMTPSGKKIQAIGILPDVKLKEVEGKWVENHALDSQIIREVDLRNHLTATIETEEEKKMRLEREKRLREARIKEIKRRRSEKKNKNKGKKRMIKKDPADDYQVIQAVNYLKSLQILKKGIKL